MMGAMSSPFSRPIDVTVVGATGAAFPVRRLRALASARSAGRTVRFDGNDLVVEEVDDTRVGDAPVVFFAAGGETSRRYAPVVAAAGGVAVDKSSAYRMAPDVPLIVPEVNASSISGHRGILANPNCVTIPLTVALAPLHRARGLRHLTVATYQAASGGGLALMGELTDQTRAAALGEPLTHPVYPHVLHGNVVPGGWAMRGADSDEEVKVVAETRRVLGLPDLGVSVTTVRVPVTVGHSAAVWAEFDQPLSAAEAQRLLVGAAGVRLVDDPAAQVYPTPLQAAGGDEVLVGRVRDDASRPGAIVLFLSVDNLRKGAATNAVQVAELALGVGRGLVTSASGEHS